MLRPIYSSGMPHLTSISLQTHQHIIHSLSHPLEPMGIPNMPCSDLDFLTIQIGLFNSGTSAKIPNPSTSAWKHRDLFVRSCKQLMLSRNGRVDEITTAAPGFFDQWPKGNKHSHMSCPLCPSFCHTECSFQACTRSYLIYGWSI